MLLTDLGWDDRWGDELAALGRPELRPARVSVDHRIRYRVSGADGTESVELGGKLRHSAGRLGRPAVGDWVGVHQGRIEALLPRRSGFVRRSNSEPEGAQVVAANVDTVFIVAAADRELNVPLMERYLAAAAQGGATPVVVLNKIDACQTPAPELPLADISRRGVPVEKVSALLRSGHDALLRHIGRGTVALVGLSGAGKTSLANWLLGRDDLRTAAVSTRDGQGKHTTSHRELYLLPEGGVLIDTPGMRELALWMSDADLVASFADLAELARSCRFENCQHQTEPGCAVLASLADGVLTRARLEQFQKLQHEQAASIRPGARPPTSARQSANRSNARPRPRRRR